MSKAIFNIINPTDNDYPWKLAIKALFNRGDIIVPHHDMNDTILKAIKQDCVLSQVVINKPLSFLKFCNIEVKDNPNEVAYLKSVYYQLHLTLDRAASLDLVEIEEKKPKASDGTNYSAYRYTLTSKGLDVVIKLQEHEDNEKRYTASLTLSKRAFIVSLVAVFAATISTVFNYYRLDLYEKQITKSEQNKVAIELPRKPLIQPKIKE